MSRRTLRGDDTELDDIRDGLIARAEELARDLLGEPNRALSSKRELRWGSKGSMALALHGQKRGQWFDHSASQGGDLIALIQVHQPGCRDFPQAKAWARGFLG